MLSRLNVGVQGAVFIQDDDSKVLGMFTDGDVRRAILSGASLDDDVTNYMNTGFVRGDATKSRMENMSLLNEKIRHIPVLDEHGQLVEMLTWTEMLNLPLMTPSLGGNELKYVNDCIVSGWISSQGEYVRKFEDIFSKAHMNYHAVASSSGTAALHLALQSLELELGDEVLIPDLTFAATANVVLHCNLVPVCVDINIDTWNIDIEKIEEKITTRTKVIIPVHLYGHPCDMDSIMTVARNNNLYVIEDCAEAQGALYKGQPVGTFGHAGCFSFFSNKVITTGEGGMVISKNAGFADKVRLYRDHGMNKTKRYWHDVPGFNYRMTNMQAAIGLAQMERIDKFVSTRRHIGKRYIERLKDIEGLVMPPEKDWASTIYWIFSILIDEEKTGIKRDHLIERLKLRNIETRPFFFPLHLQKPYLQDGEFPIANKLANCGVSLPSANDITDDSIDRVCLEIKDILNKNQ